MQNAERERTQVPRPICVLYSGFCI